MSFEDMPTEDLVRLIEAPLIQWRRLPVKHANQIPQRDHVTKAFELLRDRLIAHELKIKVLEERNQDLMTLVFGEDIPIEVANNPWVSLLDRLNRWKRDQADLHTVKDRQREARIHKAQSLKGLFKPRRKLDE